MRHLESARGKCCLAGIVIAGLFIAGSAVWIGVAMPRVSRQREAREILEEIGGIVTYHWQDEYVDSPYPRWLERALGKDFLGRIDEVLLFDKSIPHEAVEQLGVLRDLESLNLHNSTIKNEELVYIQRLHKLQYLDLGCTGISDSGLEHMGCLNGLESLKLDDTEITDIGLIHLGTLARLKTLDLCGTHVTDAGILQLGRLQSLEELELYNTAVTSRGVAELKKVLPRLYIGENTGGNRETGAKPGSGRY